MDCTLTTNVTPIIVRICLLRVILTVCIFYLRDVSPITKIIAILSLDFIKNAPFLPLCNSKKGYPSFITNKVYQTIDKPLDLFSYWLCFSILLSHNLVSPHERRVLCLILIIRTIAVMVYTISGNGIYLVFGVDLFKEWLLVYALTSQKGIWRFPLLLMSAIGKIWIEYRFHIQKKGLSNR